MGCDQRALIDVLEVRRGPAAPVGAAPPISSRGDCASWAFFSAVMVLLMPGPAVTAATPGRPDRRGRRVGCKHRCHLVTDVDDANAALPGGREDR